MNKFIKYALKISPYLVSLGFGILAYWVGNNVKDYNEHLSIVLTNTSFSLLGLVIIFIFYETIKSWSNKKLYKELFDYMKFQIDDFMLSIINQNIKYVYEYGKNRSLKDINNFLNEKETDLTEALKRKTFIGFQIFKTFKSYENHLHEILKNPYSFKVLDNDQILSLLMIIKNIRHLNKILINSDLYIKEKEKSHLYTIHTSDVSETTSPNTPASSHKMLLKKLGDNSFQVQDFGFFETKEHDNELLNYFNLKDEMIPFIARDIVNTMKSIKAWIKSTGGEFVLDSECGT